MNDNVLPTTNQKHTGQQLDTKKLILVLKTEVTFATIKPQQQNPLTPYACYLMSRRVFLSIPSGLCTRVYRALCFP